MHYSGAPTKFDDCVLHGRGIDAELFVVEGDSAAGAVANLRDAQTQAVLPMQGKPLNALRANGERVSEYSLFKQLAAALGVPTQSRLRGYGIPSRFSIAASFFSSATMRASFSFTT